MTNISKQHQQTRGVLGVRENTDKIQLQENVPRPPGLIFQPLPFLLSFVFSSGGLFVSRPGPARVQEGGGDRYLTNVKGAVRVPVTFSSQLGHDVVTHSSFFHQGASPVSCSLRSYKDLSERVGPGTADVALGGVERYIVDGLLELLAVGGELLDAGFALHVPQTDRTVVTSRHEV